MKNANAHYKQVKTGLATRTSPKKRKLQRQRERCAKRLKSKEEELERSDETEVLPIINFHCHEPMRQLPRSRNSRI